MRAWQSAFDDLFTPIDEMPDELRQHLRYPEDLFRVQTELYSKYQVGAGRVLLAQRRMVGRAGAVDRPPGQLDRVTAAAAGRRRRGCRRVRHRVEHARGSCRTTRCSATAITGEEEFVILRPFVPFSTNDRRTELQAYLTASSDPETYGKLVSYVVAAGSAPARAVARRRPGRVGAGHQPAAVAAGERGDAHRVVFGDLQLVPVADGLLYIRPVYVVVGNDVPEFRYVIVSTGSNAVIGTDLENALAQLFPGFEEPIGDRVPDSGDDTESRHRRAGRGDERRDQRRDDRQTERRGIDADNGDAIGEPARRRRSCSTRPRSCSRRPRVPAPPATSAATRRRSTSPGPRWRRRSTPSTPPNEA